MAATTITHPLINRNTKVCFSFAAYSKDLIAHLHHHSNVPVAQGLTETELSTIESSFNFSFPPDLRAILREGLPVGQGFPDWRSSSSQQLDILVNLPILGLCKEVSRQKFWHHGWGDRPEDDDEAVELARRYLKKSPVLVPVYQNCYIPTCPCLSGNPVFYVSGSEVKLCSYDVIGLFHQIEFREGVVSGMRLGHFLKAPVWAATEARRIEFWTELVESCEQPLVEMLSKDEYIMRPKLSQHPSKRSIAKMQGKEAYSRPKLTQHLLKQPLAEMQGKNVYIMPKLAKRPSKQPIAEMQGKIAYIRPKLAKHTPGPIEKRWWARSELGQCLDDVWFKLRAGGWKEEDLDEMMMGMNNGDEKSSSSSSPSPRSSLASWSSSSDDDGRGGVTNVKAVTSGREDVVRILSQRLLRGGWSMGDVVESLGCLTESQEDRTVQIENRGGGDSLFDFEHNSSSCVDDSQSHGRVDV